MTPLPAASPSLTPVTKRPAWLALKWHYHKLRNSHLCSLFRTDPGRAERFTAEAVGLYLDYSKNRINRETMQLLLRLAEESALRARIDGMFRGDRVNLTEERAVLHMAAGAPGGGTVVVDRKDVMPKAHAVLDRMSAFSNRVRGGTWHGHTGKRIRNVVNIGIGVSDLGPVMAYEALKPYADRSLTFRFASNADGTDFAEAVRDLDAAETLFIVSARACTTLETMTNAHTARAWLLAHFGSGDQAVARHFVAVSTNTDALARFGIDPSNMFEFWDWAAGRYSMVSSISLSTMLAIGPENFRVMLDGCHGMGEHFRSAPFDRNLPVIMGLLSTWYTNFFGAEMPAVLPYDQHLKRFPAYLQQLTTENNEKQATLDDKRATLVAEPIHFGEPGANGQHSFHQVLHQGTRLVPCDFIAFCRPLHFPGRHHDLLMANVLAQSEALAFGETASQVEAEGTPVRLGHHRACEGNRPSNTILADQLTPATLGKLVALYEHSVFTQGAIWQINSLDQWGVELGKALAKRIVSELESKVEPELRHDSSTNALIRHYRRFQNGGS